MTGPYCSFDGVTLWHGDARELWREWTIADLLFTDPPYGIGWRQGDFGGTNGSPHGGIVNDRDTAVRDAILHTWGTDRPGIVFGSPLVAAPTAAKQALVWHKPPTTGVLGAFGGWRRDWEAIYLTGTWPMPPVQRSGVIRTNGAHSNYIVQGMDRHPHAKPVALLEVLLQHAPPGTVADPFAGSGSTLVAARNQGRPAVGVEIDEAYCEITARRLSQAVLDFGART